MVLGEMTRTVQNNEKRQKINLQNIHIDKIIFL